MRWGGEAFFAYEIAARVLAFRQFRGLTLASLADASPAEERVLGQNGHHSSRLGKSGQTELATKAKQRGRIRT
jgi:hypothetical protein